MAKMKMVSMKRSAEDRRKDAGEPPPITSIAPDFPYGLCIHMDKDELDKIGFKELPEVGAVLPLQVLVKVTAVRQSAVEGADEETSVDFQITDMAVDTGD